MPERKNPAVPPEPDPKPAAPAARLERRYEFFTEFIDEFADAVSFAGIFVRSESPPPPGTAVEFEFRLGEEIVLLAGRGTVAWVREAGAGAEDDAPAGLAIRFEKLGTGSGKVIRRLRAAHEQRGGQPFRLGGAEEGEEEVPESGSYEAAELLGAAPAEAPEAATPEALRRALREADAARQELGRRRAELARARSGLEELTTRLEASERELDAARSEVVAHEAELKTARQELIEAGRRLRSLEKARAEAERDRETVEHLEAALGERAEELERLQRKFEIKAENEKSLEEEVAKLAAARDELRSALDAKEAELAWLRGRAPEGGESVPEATADASGPLADAQGVAGDLRQELDEARRTIAAIQEETLRAGREAPTVAIAAPARSRPRAILAAAALALAGAAIGALAVWRLAPAAPPAPPAEVAAGSRALVDPRAPASAEPADLATRPAASSPGSPPEAVPEAAEVAAAAAPADPLDAVSAWAAAWSEQRVEEYLAAYSEEFGPPAGMDRRQWAEQRRERLLRPTFIRVVVEEPRVEDLGPARARVRFRQIYESESFSDEVYKTLDLALENGLWRIVAERSE